MGRRWTIGLAALTVAAACSGPGTAGPVPPCSDVPTTTTSLAVPVPAAPATTPVPPTGSAVTSALGLQVTPSAVVLDGFAPQPVVVVVSNSGTGTIAGVSVRLVPSAGVAWRPESPVDGLTLAPQDRQVVRGALVGRRAAGGSTSVVVQGAVDGSRTAVELATIAHAPAPPFATLAVSGPGKLSNGRVLELTALVVNTGDAPVRASLDGWATNAGKITVDVPCKASVVEPGDAVRFVVTVDGDDLRSGDETAFVNARISRGDVTDTLSAGHPLATSPFGDTTLVGPLGLASLLLLPGLVALMAWMVVRGFPRRRRGVIASDLPDIKNLGTAIRVVVLSAAAVELYRRIAGESLYDGYSASSLGAVTAGALIATVLAGLARWRYVEWRYPVVDHDTDARVALDALPSWFLPAATLEEVTGRVVWVHDGAACVVSGLQVRGTIPGSALDEAMNTKNLRTLKEILEANPHLTVAYVGPDPAGIGARTGAVGAAFEPHGRGPVIDHSITP